MAAMTDFMENKLIDFIFRAQALGIGGATAAAGTGPSTLYVGLLTAVPTDATGGTEVVTAGPSGYGRVALASSLANWAGTQAAASTTASSGTSGQTSNNGVIQFGAPTAAWGVVVAMGIWDASTGGNLLIYSPLAANKTINSGDAAPAFTAAALTFTIDN